MATPFTLSYQQIESFAARGVLRLPGLLTADAVERARAAVLAPLAALGLWRDGAWRLGAGPKPLWPDKGLSARAVGNKHAAVEALFEAGDPRAVVDALLEGRAVDRTIFKRPQVLVTLPNAGEWRVPPHWHVDVPRLASGAAPGVQLFFCLDHVAPRGGGTLVIAGSHLLLNEGRFIHNRDVIRQARRDASFRDLLGDDAPFGQPRLVSRGGGADPVALELMELAGAPGDVHVMDLRVLHTGAPNATDRPRLMAAHRYLRADLMGELAGAVADSTPLR